MQLFDTKEHMIRTLSEWDSKTFSDAISDFQINDDDIEVAKLMIDVVGYQRLGDKKMNGYCSEDLRKDEFENMGVCYVDFFNMLEASDKQWTPLDIIFEICKNNLNRRSFYEKKAEQHNMTFEKVTALMCGRALRALPSYLREYQLRNALKDAFPKAMFTQTAETDKKWHCDIQMTLNERQYYFWSFLSSPRAIYQFVDKFKANRSGVILDGNHVLCPFNKMEDSDTSYRGWCFYSNNYINEIKTAIYQKMPTDYNDVSIGKTFNLRSFKRPIVVSKYTCINA